MTWQFIIISFSQTLTCTHPFIDILVHNVLGLLETVQILSIIKFSNSTLYSQINVSTDKQNVQCTCGSSRNSGYFDVGQSKQVCHFSYKYHKKI